MDRLLSLLPYIWVLLLAIRSNVPNNDDWRFVWLTSRTLSGQLTMGDLWTQTNENRMLFPNLLFIVLGRRHPRANVQVIMLVSAGLLVGAFLVFLSLFRHYTARPLTAFSVLSVGLIWFSTRGAAKRLMGVTSSRGT